ncbi:MAG: DUF1826 domain-containing protein [Qingshengfaniella sp.]
MLDSEADQGIAGVAVGASEVVLDQIGRPDTAAVLWQRRLDPGVQAWLDALPAEGLPQMRAALRVEDVGRAVDAALTAAGHGPNPWGRMLCDDVQALATRFAGIMGQEKIELRLDAISGNACTRFHVDFVSARLLCTYRGLGTEYGIAEGAGDPAAPNQMQPGWVGLFRGRTWPSPAACGLVHRSPPIAGTGETRLLLVIDVAEPED